MPDSGAIRAGRAFIELFTDDVKVQAGLKKVSAKMKSWGAAMTVAGGKAIAGGLAIAGPLAYAAKVYASLGSELAEASAKTGISVEQLSRLSYAADQSGISMESLEGAVLKMQKSLYSASTGGKEAQGALRKLGLSAASLQKLSPDEQFAAIAEALSEVTNESQKSGLAMKIFGKSGAELKPLLEGGAEGLNAMIQRANELGIVVSGSDAAGAKEFGQRWKDLLAVGTSLAFVVGSAVAPALKFAIQTTVAGVKAVREFVKEHKSLAIGAGIAAVALLAVGGALVTIGTTLAVAGIAISGVIGTLGAIGGAIAAMITSPLAAMVFVVGGAVAALLKFTSAGDLLIRVLGPAFTELKNLAMTTFGGITDALTSGNWSLAAKILWTALKIEWANGVNYLSQVWSKLKFAIEEKTTDLAASMQKLWSYIMEYMSSWAGVKAAATKFMNWMENAFTATVNYVADKLQDWFMETGKKQLKIELAKTDEQEKSGKIDHATAELQRRSARDTFGDYDDKARSQRDQARKHIYDQRQKAADDQFAAADPDVASAENARMRIEKEREQARAQHIKELQDQIAKTVDPQQLVDLRKQLSEQVTQAHTEAAGQAKKSAEQKAKDFSAGLQGSSEKSIGTFNAAAAFGLGSGGPAERIAKNTEKTNQLLQKWLEIRAGGYQRSANDIPVQ